MSIAESIRLRAATSDDLAELHLVLRRSERADGLPRVTGRAEFDAELTEPPVVMADDIRIAETSTGMAVGFVHTYHLPSEVREERCYVAGAVDPPWRRRGIGTMLMTWAVARAEDQLRSSGRDLPCSIRSTAFDFQHGALALLDASGLVATRWGEEMVRPLTGPMPDVVLPPGVRVVAWPTARSDEIRTVKNLAFADHWGSTPTSVEQWRQTTEGPGARLDLSFVAVHDDVIIGHCLCKRFPDDDAVTGGAGAWIDNLGTLREWRGRGVASALIAAALTAFTADGLDHARLGVDTDNPTGAARLYRALGFQTAHRQITGVRDVAR